MNMTVKNKNISIGNIQVEDVVSSSVFIIGDAEIITCSSIFDTPADSLILSPQVPLPRKKKNFQPSDIEDISDEEDIPRKP